MLTPANYLKQKIQESVKVKRESDHQLTIADFLQDIEFIAPEGFEIDYFIIPMEGLEEFQDKTDEELSQGLVFPETPQREEATIMVKKDLRDRQVDLTTASSPVSFLVPPLNNGGPKPTRTIDDQIFTQGGFVPSASVPFKEEERSEEEEQTLLLRESTKVFPKGTKIHLRSRKRNKK